MDQGVAEKAHPTQHNPGPDEGQGHGGEGAPEKRPLLKGELKRLEEPVHPAKLLPRGEGFGDQGGVCLQQANQGLRS
jgi:hypothetical protein